VTEWVEIEPHLCECGCGTFITKKSKLSQGRFVQGHAFKSAINLVPDPDSLLPEEYDRIKKIPAWKAMMENMQEITTQVLNGKQVLSYGLLEDLD